MSKRIRGAVAFNAETEKYNFAIFTVDIKEPDDESKWRLVCRGREEGYDTEEAAAAELADCFHRIEQKLTEQDCQLRSPGHAASPSLN